VSIKLAVALEDNKLKKHIRDRLDRSKSYTCPFCNEPVIAKKGQERQHHFAHAPGTNCIASEETILHFNAKHYLAYCIKQNIDIVFNVSEELIEPKLNSVLTSLGINQYPLSLNSLVNFYKKAGVYVEKTVGPYVVDVYMQHESYTYGFVFEIVVTHEIEPEKLQWLHENNVPYLEISPVSDDNTFIFKVIRINLPRYFARIENNFINSSVATYYEEIHDMIKSYIQTEQSKKFDKELKLQAWDWAVDKILYGNLRKWVPDEAQKQMKSLTIRPFNDPQTGTAKMFGAKYKRVREHRMVFATDNHEKETLVLNDKVLLSELLNRLAIAYPTEMILGKGQNGREGVIGFHFQNLIDPITYEEEWKRNMEQFLQSVRDRLEQQNDADEDDE
jgi:hypothetical protein